MSIEKLPDDCLDLIFDKLKHLPDLHNCSLVSPRFNHLIIRKFKRIGYTINIYVASNFRVSRETLCQLPTPKVLLSANADQLECKFGSMVSESATLTTVSKILTENIKMLDLFFNKMPDSLPLGRLQDISRKDHTRWINMFSSTRMIYINKVEDGKDQLNVVQLHIEDPVLFPANPENVFPNLQRLHCHNVYGTTYNRHMFRSLTILEMNYRTLIWSDALDIIQFCPALKSAYMVTRSSGLEDIIKIEEGVKYVLEQRQIWTHKNLEDLVFCWYSTTPMRHFNCERINKMMKYFSIFPNLKHLAIRDNEFICSYNVPQLLDLLPNLVLLDVRGCPGILPSFLSWPEETAKYCSKFKNRQVKVYIKNGDETIKKDWPETNFSIKSLASGFDFMKNCFFRKFEKLPLFLEPIDD